MKFTLREKYIRLLNKLPKPMVTLLGIAVLFLADPISAYLMSFEGVPKFMYIVVQFIPFAIGLDILFSPSEYKLLKKVEEYIDDEDERRQFIYTKAKAKTSVVIQWIFVSLFLICMISEELKAYCFLWGSLLLIQVILEYIMVKKLEKAY